MNTSKVRDQRFWKLWANSGALETYQDAVAREEKALQERAEVAVRAAAYADWVMRTFTGERIGVSLSSDQKPVLHVPEDLSRGFHALTRAMRGNQPSQQGVLTINSFFGECGLSLIAEVPPDDALSVRGEDWPKFLRFASAIGADYAITSRPKVRLSV